MTTPLTFSATANVIVQAGATPVFADVDAATMNLSPEAAAAAVTPRTRALLPVHFAGRPVDTGRFRAQADQSGLSLIEDAAHCVEGSSQGVKVGASADFTCFSLYATKNLTTGEGGMVTTPSAEWADLMRVCFNSDMSDLQAAIGIHQLAAIERRLVRRQHIWRRYDDGLAGLPLTLPAPVRPGDRHARHLYTILVDERECGRSRDDLQAALRARHVATSIHFKALHLHSYYAERYGLRRGMFPVAESISDRILSLPLSPALGDDEIDRIIEAVRGCLRRTVSGARARGASCASRPARALDSAT